MNRRKARYTTSDPFHFRICYDELGEYVTYEPQGKI